MGIEPTERTVNVRPNGFEDRAQHQLWKRFRKSCQRYPADHPLSCNESAD